MFIIQITIFYNKTNTTDEVIHLNYSNMMFNVILQSSNKMSLVVK